MLAFFSMVPMGTGVSFSSCTIKIDDHAGRSGRLTGKIASIENALGREVNK